MKVITIGRSDENQIVLEDNQNLISRQHATLRIHETGKMEIVSTGSNGTFVNGFRIKSNVPYKVTRKDVISFAHVRQLDWTMVPDPFRIARFSIIGLVIVVIIAVATVLLWPEKKDDKPTIPSSPTISNPISGGDEQKKPKETSPESPKEEAAPDKPGDLKFPPLNTGKKPDPKPDEEKPKPEKQPDEAVIPAL